MTAYKAYKTEYDYFTMGDVRTTYITKYKLKDEKELAPIQEMHRVFNCGIGMIAVVGVLGLGLPLGAAILLGAFQNYGLQPGPLLFESQKDLVWGLIASLYVGNIILLILNLPLIGIWVKVLEIPKDLLYAGILVFATLGAYSLHQSWVDLATLYIFGLLGFAMRRWDIPVGPAVIGLILGPLAETQFRRALSISQGDATVFFTQPISATFLAITALLVIVPWLFRRFRPTSS